MNGTIQNKISPFTSTNKFDFSSAKVNEQSKAIDSNEASKTSFKDLILNSNEDISKERQAQKNGDGLRAAKTDAEFAKMMTDKVNRDSQRSPQNALDKDAFLKLFMTQMQNQDPLNPDDSSEMAAQLAQFNGLEQMMNVNKNLEKMQSEQALSRAVGLTSFVDKEVKIMGGRASLKAGRISHLEARVERDIPQVNLEVRNSAGVLVDSKDLGGFKAGSHKIEWNGIGNDGKKSPDGVYTISLSAKDMTGQDVPIEISSSLSVKSVDLREPGGMFHTDIGPVRVSEIASVGSFLKNEKGDNAVDLKSGSIDPSEKTRNEKHVDMENKSGNIPISSKLKSENKSKITPTGDIVST